MNEVKNRILITILTVMLAVSWPQLGMAVPQTPNLVTALSDTGIAVRAGGGDMTGGGYKVSTAFGQAFQTQVSASSAYSLGNDHITAAASFSNCIKVLTSTLTSTLTSPSSTKFSLSCTDRIKTHQYADARQNLNQAEQKLRMAIQADPFNPDYVTKLLQARMDEIRAGNLLVEHARKDTFEMLYSANDEMLYSANDDPSAQELNNLQTIVDQLWEQLDHLIALYLDELPNGPGAYLRGELQSESRSDLQAAVQKYGNLFYTTAQKWLEVQHRFARKQLMQAFLVEIESAKVIKNLNQAADNMTALLQMVSGFITPLPNERSDGPMVSLELDRLRQLADSTNQGYNPFGFAAEFVPIYAGIGDGGLGTFNALSKAATTAIDNLNKKETEIKNNKNESIQFAKDKVSYLQNLSTQLNTHNARLIQLTGSFSDQKQLQPDLLTFAIPDFDIDGDGISERQSQRNKIVAEGKLVADAFINGASKGLVGEQDLKISNAKSKVDQAFIAMRNNVASIEAEESAAHERLAALNKKTDKVIFYQQDLGEKEAAVFSQKAAISKMTENKNKMKGDAKKYLEPSLNLAGNMAIAYAARKDPTAQYAALQGASTAASQIIFDVIDDKSPPYDPSNDLMKVDQDIARARAATQANITLAESEWEKDQILIDSKLKIQELVRENAKLEIDYLMASRDYDREWLVRGNLLSEVSTLFQQASQFEARIIDADSSNSLWEYERNDISLMGVDIAATEQYLETAQVWAYMTIKALSYYLNLPPGKTQFLDDFYSAIYKARGSDQLNEVIDAAKNIAINNESLFTGVSKPSCAIQEKLSFKNLIFSNYVVSADFEYTTSENRHFKGQEAYQALFREKIKQNIHGHKGDKSRYLQLDFAIDMFPKYDNTGNPQNPFFKPAQLDEKIAAYSVVCNDFNSSGIQVDLIGSLPTNALNNSTITLTQSGNAYVKHTAYSNLNEIIEDINFEHMNISRTYQQTLPLSMLFAGSNSGEITLTGEISGNIIPLVNENNATDGKYKNYSFSNRSVANTHWQLKINEFIVGSEFFDRIESMLNSDVPEENDYLTDIELWIGVSARSPNQSSL